MRITITLKGLVYFLIASGTLISIGYIAGDRMATRHCSGLQILDCGHIVHNGDTVRFTTLPVK